MAQSFISRMNRFRPLRRFATLAFSLPLLSCATPSVEQSQSALWQRFGQHGVDDIVIAWGAPNSEAKLSDGTRVLTYRRTRTYWRQFQGDFTNFGDTVECDASFFAAPPSYRITSLTLAGYVFQCDDMASGVSGPSSPPSGPF